MFHVRLFHAQSDHRSFPGGVPFSKRQQGVSERASGRTNLLVAHFKVAQHDPCR